MEVASVLYISSAISAGVGFWQLLAEGFASALVLMLMAYALAGIANVGSPENATS